MHTMKSSLVVFHIVSVLSSFTLLQSSVAAFLLAPKTKCPPQRQRRLAATTATTTKLSVVPSKKNTDNQNVQNLFYQNQAWKARKLVEDPDFFYRYGAQYTPEFMWIGSSDACVPPNVLLQEEPQNVFVTRNVANMVMENDLNQMAAMEYAVDVLQVKHIIVCGEYGCGAVLAAMNNGKGILNPPLDVWVQEIRDVAAANKKELDEISSSSTAAGGGGGAANNNGNGNNNNVSAEEQRNRRLVELNTIRQCVNVLKCNVVRNRRKATYETGEAYLAPLVHAMVFDPNTGDLKRLDIPFDDSTTFAAELSEVDGFKHLSSTSTV